MSSRMLASGQRLNEGERVIGEAKAAPGLFILTNQRVVHVVSQGATRDSVSFNLENLDSVEGHSKVRPGWLVSGILLLVGGAYILSNGGDDFGTLLLVVGGVFLIVFIASRRRMIVLHSGRSSIRLNASNWTANAIHVMLQEIDQAKQPRLDALRHGGGLASPSVQSSTPPASPLVRLDQLKELLGRGHISTEEFEAAKKRILESI